MDARTVDIVVPCRNEGNYLEKNIEHIVDTLKSERVSFKWRILIGEDNSTDNTYAVAKKLARKHSTVKAFHFVLRSKDLTIKKLWMESNADIMMFTDADNSADPKFIPALIAAIQSGHAIAAGCRFHSKENSRGWYRDTISSIYNKILLPLILPTGVRDTQCGFKAVNRQVVNEVVSKIVQEKRNGFFDSELLGVAYHKGFRPIEVPITWRETRQSVLSVNKNIPNFLKNIVKTRYRILRGYYD